MFQFVLFEEKKESNDENYYDLKPLNLMVQTFFEAEGERYKLKYQKVETIDGELYQGILFLATAIGFSYIMHKDKSISFDNKFLSKNLQKIIIAAIAKREKKSRRK